MQDTISNKNNSQEVEKIHDEEKLCSMIKKTVTKNLNIGRPIHMNFITAPLYSLNKEANIEFSDNSLGDLVITLNMSFVTFVLATFHHIKTHEDRIELSYLSLMEYTYREILNYFIFKIVEKQDLLDE